MNLEQSFTVPYPAEQVWRAFQDVPGIVACLPGAALAEPPAGQALKLSMTVKLGPIVAAFAGEGAMTLDQAARAGRISGGGADRKSGSRVKGEAAFSLHEQAGQEGAAVTRVDVKVDYAITGALAQFSRGGIVRELAQRLTQAFAENLRQKLAADVPAGAPAALAADAPGADAPAVDASRPAVAARAADAGTGAGPRAGAPLELGHFFWPALWARIRRWFGAGRKPDRTGR
ncbi:SRPBCC family protein [Orrella sp. JC864]|uniref:SRPBCC family protein n=1 Tax=Orrella sp. JC864 TaxID=3120298 RepID=UPI00142B2970